MRENQIVSITNGQFSSVIDLDSKLACMSRLNEKNYFANIDSSFTCFSQQVSSSELLNIQGLILFTVKGPSPIVAMEPFEVKSGKLFSVRKYSLTNSKGMLVAFSNLELRVYTQNILVNILKC